jgi:hypothetical protein
MVCYARPAGRMAAVVLVVLLVFGRHVRHFFDAAALTVAITVAAGGAAVAAAVAFAAFLSIRRRRAAAGGCVSCQLRCQHAMTEQPRRLVVSTVEHGPVAARSGTVAAPAGVVAAPAGVVAARGGPAAPRWPDRPAYRSGAAGRPGGHFEGRERAGSAVLPDLVLAGPHRGMSGLARSSGTRPDRLSTRGRRSPACRRRMPCRSGCTYPARVRRPTGCSGDWPWFLP